MNTYHKNGTMSEIEYIISDTNSFAIQHDICQGRHLISYPGDRLVRELEQELIDLYDKFVAMYFPDLSLYYKESYSFPMGLALGGQSSDSSINKHDFVDLVEQYKPYFTDVYRHLYVADCQYLISTVQNLLVSAEYCFTQYYTQIAQIECRHKLLDGTYITGSEETMQLSFYLETFFVKLYSVLDLMVKIIYEIERPIESFSKLTKIKGAEKLWGDRKDLNINKLENTIFEDCEAIKQIESIRNEAVHNGAWELNPKVFFVVKDQEIIERYMMFPDFDEGRLSTVKNRRHFFSKGTKVNDALVLIHNEFYQRFLTTLQYINSNTNH